MSVAFFNGRIRTMESGSGALGPECEVLVIDEGRIRAAGDHSLIEAHPDAERRDLAGRYCVPGLIDAHHHLSITALHPRWADLTHVTTAEGVFAALRDQAAREPSAAWIRAFNWRPSAGAAVTRRDIDDLQLGRPVILSHWTLHQCLVDSLGLRALGIDRASVDPPGGNILRDDDGAPTGRLIETAGSVAHARSIADYTREGFPDRIADRARALLAEGITAVHDAAVAPAAIAAYRDLASRDALPISVLALPHSSDMLVNPDAATIDGLTPGDGDETFRLGPVKFFADSGSLPALRGHRDGKPVEFGTVSPGLASGVRAVAARGWPVAIHANGSLGVDAALDAVEGVDLPSAPRFEHCVVMAAGQAQRIAAAGARAVVQPSFIDMFATAAASGFRFDDLEFATFRSLQDAGVVLAASSDAPCAEAHPLADYAFGVTRRGLNGYDLHPEQTLDYATWLRAATIGAATAGGQEQERGSLRPGKRADLVILSGELDADAPPTVAETWVGGERVYTAAE